MSDIDDKIREALKSEDESESLFEEKGMLAEVVAPFRGKRRWVNFLGLTYGVIANAILVWAAIRFFSTDVVNDRLIWLAVGGLATLFVAFIKVYFWMEMHSNRVLREVKRVELLVLSRTERNDD